MNLKSRFTQFSFILTVIVLCLTLTIPMAHGEGLPLTITEEEINLDSNDVFDLLNDNSYVGYDSDFIKSIQKALNKKLSKSDRIKADGIFGPATDLAIRKFQRKAGLTIDGIVGPKTLKALGLPDEGIYPRFAPNLLDAFNEGANDLAAHLNLNSCLLEVYKIDEEGWHLIRIMSCALGDQKNGNYTPAINKVLDGSGHSAISGKNGNREWAGDNAVRIKGGYFFHSILRHRKGNGNWTYDDNSALGHYVSHGCVRLSLEDSVWVKENFTEGTVLVIDERNWDLRNLVLSN